MQTLTEQRLIESLGSVCQVKNDRLLSNTHGRILTFKNNLACTTIRIIFEGENLVITNMTTLPEKQRGRGYGKASLEKLIGLALTAGIKSILAVQVIERSESFWRNSDFEKLYNETNDFQLVMKD
jgi:GNAT superfamily N-acetyltransferase